MSRRTPLRTRARALKGNVEGSITCVSALHSTVKQRASGLHQVCTGRRVHTCGAGQQQGRQQRQGPLHGVGPRSGACGGPAVMLQCKARGGCCRAPAGSGVRVLRALQDRHAAIPDIRLQTGAGSLSKGPPPQPPPNEPSPLCAPLADGAVNFREPV